MGKKNGNKNDKLKAKNGVVFRENGRSIYCNDCGEVSDTNGNVCPKCGSARVVYSESD